MARHSVSVGSGIAEHEDDDLIEEGDLFRDVSPAGGQDTYVVAQVSFLPALFILVCIDDGGIYADPDADPFDGDRADFRRIPGDRKITIE